MDRSFTRGYNTEAYLGPIYIYIEGIGMSSGYSSAFVNR
jgi:hypothetical protein